MYSLTKLNMHLIYGSTDEGTVKNYEKQCPFQIITIQSHSELPFNLDGYIALRYMDELADLNIHDYWNMDVRLAWHLFERLKIALMGQNLLHDSILEFKPELDYTQYTYPQRGVYATMEIHF